MAHEQTASDAAADAASADAERLQPSIPRERALQPSKNRLPVASLRSLARRALPVLASMATAAMTTLAAERALSRAVTRMMPHEDASATLAPVRLRRVVITERVQIERFRIRR